MLAKHDVSYMLQHDKGSKENTMLCALCNQWFRFNADIVYVSDGCYEAKLHRNCLVYNLASRFDNNAELIAYLRTLKHNIGI